MCSILELWKTDLKAVNEKAAEALADPARYPNLFADLEYALQAETACAAMRDVSPPASSYPSAKGDLDEDLIARAKEGLGPPIQRTTTAELVDEEDPLDDEDDDAGEEVPTQKRVHGYEVSRMRFFV